jgi:hypothetical protein
MALRAWLLLNHLRHLRTPQDFHKYYRLSRTHSNIFCISFRIGVVLPKKWLCIKLKISTRPLFVRTYPLKQWLFESVPVLAKT